MAVLLYFQTQYGTVPVLVAVTLLLALYLAFMEVRPWDVPMRQKAWWISLVGLTHFFGYLALRAYSFHRRRSGARG